MFPNKSLSIRYINRFRRCLKRFRRLHQIASPGTVGQSCDTSKSEVGVSSPLLHSAGTKNTTVTKTNANSAASYSTPASTSPNNTNNTTNSITNSINSITNSPYKEIETGSEADQGEYQDSDRVKGHSSLKSTSWFRKKVTTVDAALLSATNNSFNAGAHEVGASKVKVDSYTAGNGGMSQVEGIWKRTVAITTTLKAQVDVAAPIAKTSYVYYDDDDVFDAVLIDKDSGVIHVTQLLYDDAATKFYVYTRRGHKEYKLDGPHETVESAKAAFVDKYHEKFGVQWHRRMTTVGERFVFAVKKHESLETTEIIEEIIGEAEAMDFLSLEPTIPVAVDSSPEDATLATVGSPNPPESVNSGAGTTLGTPAQSTSDMSSPTLATPSTPTTSAEDHFWETNDRLARLKKLKLSIMDLNHPTMTPLDSQDFWPNFFQDDITIETVPEPSPSPSSAFNFVDSRTDLFWAKAKRRYHNAVDHQGKWLFERPHQQPQQGSHNQLLLHQQRQHNHQQHPEHPQHQQHFSQYHHHHQLHHHQLHHHQLPPHQLPPHQLHHHQLPPHQLPPHQLPPYQLPPQQVPPQQIRHQQYTHQRDHHQGYPHHQHRYPKLSSPEQRPHHMHPYHQPAQYHPSQHQPVQRLPVHQPAHPGYAHLSRIQKRPLDEQDNSPERKQKAAKKQ
ncbi:hypothetical protein BGW39_008980 [Mortierella sp. 14UC]|nr:hypothetical protein BGW39_008980 [Mortierella sp. 14UC]